MPNYQYCQGPSNLNMPGSNVTFSDSSTGNLFDFPGWEFDNGNDIGVGKVDAQFSNGSNNKGNVLLINGAGFAGGTAEKTVSQVLSTQVEQFTT